MCELLGSVDGWGEESISTIHHELRAPRRRLTIGLISNWAISDSFPSGTATPAEDGKAVGIRELAREIAAIEQDTSVQQATGDAYHSVYTGLSQNHLPELDDVGAVCYDGDRQTVSPATNLQALAFVAMVSSSVGRVWFDDANQAECVGGTELPNSITD